MEPKTENVLILIKESETSLDEPVTPITYKSNVPLSESLKIVRNALLKTLYKTNMKQGFEELKSVTSIDEALNLLHNKQYSPSESIALVSSNLLQGLQIKASDWTEAQEIENICFTLYFLGYVNDVKSFHLA